MLIAASILTALWLLLFLSGTRVSQLPAPVFLVQLAHMKQEAQERQQAALGKEVSVRTGRKKRKKTKSTQPPSKIIYVPAYKLYELVKVETRFPMVLHMLHSYLLQYYRYQWSFEATVYLVNEAVGKALLIAVAGCWIAYAAEEWAIALVAVLVAVVSVLQLYQGTKSALAQRKRAMLTELPKLLTQLTLLVGAGESVLQSFIKCIKSKQDSKHPLYVEWREAVIELNNGASFASVIEKLNRNCALQQMSMLTTILLLNVRKGGEHFISSVQELNLSLWESRKTVARLKGEEASSKMIFPLVGILLLLMVLVVAPAVMMMQIM